MQRSEVIGRASGVLLATLALLVVLPRDAAACSCASGTNNPCTAVANAAAVFLGRVLSITDADDGGRSARNRRVVHFAVIEPFIGATGEVEVRTGAGGPDCGYSFTVGSTYIVYAHRMPGGPLTTSICSRTSSASLAGGELARLRRLSRSPDSTGRVRGEVQEHDGGGRVRRQAIGGVDVIATPAGGGPPVRTSTDSKGRFEFVLPPGRYEIAIDPGPGLTSRDAPWLVNVFGGQACATRTMTLRREGG